MINSEKTQSLNNDLSLNSKVAVYGSLKKGFGNHSLISSCVPVGKGHTLPEYKMLSFGGYPGVIDGTDMISVEVYHLDNHLQLMDLDRLEGHPNFYKREIVPILLSTGTEIRAWMYTIRHHPRYSTYDETTVVNNKDDVGSVEWLEDW
jgi:gamma-glutamylcyclotransferase (GGCT)/AIG2-like uncharacterized protein YtfP